jgi:hypothetical protein
LLRFAGAHQCSLLCFVGACRCSFLRFVGLHWCLTSGIFLTLMFVGALCYVCCCLLVLLVVLCWCLLVSRLVFPSYLFFASVQVGNWEFFLWLHIEDILFYFIFFALYFFEMLVS